MSEYIGKILLNDEQYPGEDFYCDGAAEDVLLSMVQENEPTAYENLIAQALDWPVLYHLSAQRANIIRWLPFTKSDKVLEVGSGCGAITGALAEAAGSVTCVELSKKRSLINAYRHKEADNVTIRLGNFLDVEPNLDTDYDYILLIGVLEYAGSYIGGENPYVDFLKKLKPHLKETGRLIIAIENRYGLKYFAGCREDHLGTYFSGIENYPAGGPARTFGKKGLEQIFAAADFETYNFYYPYPDYKFMTTLYSDAHLPRVGELQDNLRNFDRSREFYFDEAKAFDGLLEEGEFPTFSNSFLIVLGPDFPDEKAVTYAKFSAERAAAYSICTKLYEKATPPFVRKYPLEKAAEDHIRQMAQNEKALQLRYQNADLSAVACDLTDTEKETFVTFGFAAGEPLDLLLQQALLKKDMDGFFGYLDGFVRRIGATGAAKISDYDLIFENIFVQEETWTLIDYEWCQDQVLPATHQAYRAFTYFLRDLKATAEEKEALEQAVLEHLEINEDTKEQLSKEEAAFQAKIAGGRLRLAELRERLEAKRKAQMPAVRDNLVQIYEDYGQGYREETSKFLFDARAEQNKIRFRIPVEDGIKALRIDPAFCPCVVKILQLQCNEKDLPVGPKTIHANGALFENEMVFATDDPWFSFALHTGGEIFAELEIAELPLSLASDLAARLQKRIYLG